MLQFARIELGMRVAENTRESYRKASLRPLNELGVITRHQLSTNDPNTFYRLSPLLVEPLRAGVGGRAPEDAFAEFRRQAVRKPRPEGDGPVIVRVRAGKTFELSPGEHSHLTKGFVEIFGSAFFHHPAVVYVGDTARKRGYQDRQLMRELNLPVEVKAGLPDAILFSEEDRRLVVGEVVTSTGPINFSRLEQLRLVVRGPAKLGYDVDFATAFPSRSILRRFVEEIAWGTTVWVAAEPNNIILFQARGGQQ
jgi:type II restriction enzyme